MQKTPAKAQPSKIDRLIALMAQGRPLKASWKEAGFVSYQSAYHSMYLPRARARLQAARHTALLMDDLPDIAVNELRSLLVGEDTPAHVRLRAVELVLRESHGFSGGVLAGAVEREKELHEMTAAELATVAAAGMEALQSIAAGLSGQTIDTNGGFVAVRDIEPAADDLSFLE